MHESHTSFATTSYSSCLYVYDEDLQVGFDCITFGPAVLGAYGFILVGVLIYFILLLGVIKIYDR